MPIIRPGDYRPGQRLRPGMLHTLAEGLRGAMPRRVEGRGRHLSRHGWTQDEPDEAQPATIVWGVVTGTIGARTGVYPAFVPGSGTATILDWTPGSPMTISEEGVTVYNGFEDAVPASTKLCKFGYHASGALVYINGDC